MKEENGQAVKLLGSIFTVQSSAGSLCFKPINFEQRGRVQLCLHCISPLLNLSLTSQYYRRIFYFNSEKDLLIFLEMYTWYRNIMHNQFIECTATNCNSSHWFRQTNRGEVYQNITMTRTSMTKGSEQQCGGATTGAGLWSPCSVLLTF